MWSKTRLAIPALAAGAVLMLLAGAQDTRGSQASLDELLQAEGLTRAELASLYPSLAGGSFEPPACVAGEEMFDDVPADNLFCAWIEELARRGITEGCTATRYCPGDAVTRSQMAIFIVKAQEGVPEAPSPFEVDCNEGLAPDDEMIRLGSVCVDKYEASLWDAPVGGNPIIGEAAIDAACPDNGQPQGAADCTDFYARSVAGVEPARSITWFQAQAALANSGKRLPTSAEWQMAVQGTSDPGGHTPGSEDCNTSPPGPEMTGERANCVSRWGHHDMVGNVWEWVGDWGEDAAGCHNWSSNYGEDETCVGRGDGDPTNRFPGALIRGGFWGGGVSSAGPFAVSGFNRPSFSGFFLGFRGAR